MMILASWQQCQCIHVALVYPKSGVARRSSGLPAERGSTTILALSASHVRLLFSN